MDIPSFLRKPKPSLDLPYVTVNPLGYTPGDISTFPPPGKPDNYDWADQLPGAAEVREALNDIPGTAEMVEEMRTLVASIPDEPLSVKQSREIENFLSALSEHEAELIARITADETELKDVRKTINAYRLAAEAMNPPVRPTPQPAVATGLADPADATTATISDPLGR